MTARFLFDPYSTLAQLHVIGECKHHSRNFGARISIGNAAAKRTTIRVEDNMTENLGGFISTQREVCRLMTPTSNYWKSNHYEAVEALPSFLQRTRSWLDTYTGINGPFYHWTRESIKHNDKALASDLLLSSPMLNA